MDKAAANGLMKTFFSLIPGNYYTNTQELIRIGLHSKPYLHDSVTVPKLNV